MASSVGEASSVASKEVRVSDWSPGSYWAPINRVLCRVNLSINVGLCGVLDLRETPKGEVVTVGIALYSISNSFSFSGVSKR